MLFSDLLFLFLFLPVCLIAYFAVPTVTLKNYVLIAFSLIFFAFGEPVYVLLLIGSAVMNWVIGILILKYLHDGPKGKLLLESGIAFNLLFLLIFRYVGVFVDGLNVGAANPVTLPGIHTMVGVCFFTLSAISYLMDIYWELVEPQESLYQFLLYFTMFPKIIAGPIVRYGEIAEELENRKSNANDICFGAMRFICGLAKKVILADSLWVIVKTCFGQDISTLSVLGTWYGVIIFALYLYMEISGYTDMAIGLGRIFGFHFEENFDYPFLCDSVTDFWERWHISLTNFFHDYMLTVPIFGDYSDFINPLLAGLCFGLWHGLSWNLAIWGLYLGIFLLLEHLFGEEHIYEWPTAVRQIYSKIILVIGFGILYFRDLGQLGIFLRNLFGISMFTHKVGFTDSLTGTSLLNNLFLILVSLLVSLPVFPSLQRYFSSNKSEGVYLAGRILAAVGCMILLAVAAILLTGAGSRGFLFYRF